ncbi:MAG: glycosyltransferase [Actinophytocola sp.]|uniref:glycosyltransferase family 2 protein n=1 Tax=Actinophytocola sp. TaxID=1872138 RepID=UPI003C71A3A6
MLFCAMAVLAATAWTIIYHFTWRGPALSMIFAFYLVATTIMLFTLTAAFKGRRFTSLPPAPGNVVVIVPSYNEPPERLECTVRALIEQSRPPDAIHVVDDGSSVPVVPFDHPKVTWHRQDNQGKRYAQANVLRRLAEEDVDFIVTVDSDSRLDRDAVEHLLRAMSDPRIQAATGLMMVHNRTAKLVTRVIDLEIVTWGLVTRMARSILGVVAPTSGVMAIYRKDLVYDNLDDYVTSGTVGDDRRLTHYALQRGQVVAVNEARVHTAMPEHVGELFRQRTRWFKSYWRYTPWELEHFSVVPLLFRLYALVLAVIAPITYLWILVFLPEQGPLVLLQCFGYWVIITWAQTGIYAVMRPELDLRTRLTAWLFLTPLVSLMNLLIIKPALYWAVIKARDLTWQTRRTVS